MSHQLTIDVPDEVYQPLFAKAEAAGQTAESLALELVAKGIAPITRGELLRKWFGAFDSGISDAAERHDDYIGQALYDELQGK